MLSHPDHPAQVATGHTLPQASLWGDGGMPTTALAFSILMEEEITPAGVRPMEAGAPVSP